MMRKICEWIARWRKSRTRTIYDRAGVSPYLSRTYLLGGPRSLDVIDSVGPTADADITGGWPVNIFLHKFHRGDDDLALHNHPWKWSFSIILAGGYAEERRVTHTAAGKFKDGSPITYHVVEMRLVKPWSINIIRDTDFHRVDLLEADCWSLFVAGPRVGSWGFWSRTNGMFTPWREFIEKRRE
jgi:hypothetical protein